MALPQRMLDIEKDFYTEQDYFDVERNSVNRWEYVGGQIRMMSGGTDDHNAISVNVVRSLSTALLPKGCRVYGSDMKIHTGDGTNTYPDVAVVCGARQYHQGRTDILTNPVLIVEVLSDSTEGYDRGDKFDHYKTIPTLHDYLLVAQDEARVMLYTRHEDHWDYRDITGLESSVSLLSVDVTLALTDIYTLIEF